MAERFANTVRFRVTFPKVAYDRLEALANRLAMEVPDLVRVMTSVQLVQWEAAYLNPRSLLASDAELEKRFEASAAALFPDHPELQPE